VSMEVPSTSAGVLSEIRVGAGEVAPVGAVVAVIAGAAGAVARPQAAKPAAPERVAVVTTAAAAAPASRAQAAPMKLDPFFEVRTPERNYGPARLPGGATVTPLARRLAGEAGIDLARVTPSGPHGRIVARAKAHNEQLQGNHNAISVTELPYDVNKASLIEKIADLVQNKKLAGISDISEEGANGYRRIHQFHEVWHTAPLRLMAYSFDTAHFSFVHKGTFGQFDQQGPEPPLVPAGPLQVLHHPRLGVAEALDLEQARRPPDLVMRARPAHHQALAAVVAEAYPVLGALERLFDPIDAESAAVFQLSFGDAVG